MVVPYLTYTDKPVVVSYKVDRSVADILQLTALY
jgi:hypothetical protein